MIYTVTRTLEWTIRKETLAYRLPSVGLSARTPLLFSICDPEKLAVNISKLGELGCQSIQPWTSVAGSSLFQIEMALRREHAETNLGALGEWVGFQCPLVYAGEIKYTSREQVALACCPSDRSRQEWVLCGHARRRNRCISV